MKQSQEVTRRSGAAFWLAIGLTIGFITVAIFSLGKGMVHIPPGEILSSIAQRAGAIFGLEIGSPPSHPQGESTLWMVRLPRVILSLVVGAALAVAGALMQGVFTNPLAEPGVIGVSSGAAVGASAVIVFGGSVMTSGLTVTFAAFVGGMLTITLVYLLARTNGRTEVVTLILTGIAVNAFAGGLIAFFTFIADTGPREQIVFWQLGSLNGATWQAVQIVAPLTIVGTLFALLLASKLDLLSLGEKAARHLGVNVERLRLVMIILIGLLVAGAVAFAGIISFVGLVIPHLVRMMIGPAHKYLILNSALGGAFILALADLGARTLVENADLPLGMITSLVGGPFFFWLLLRTRKRQGGWA